MQRAIVIGAGIGGLSAAINLQRQGWQVTVLEKNDSVGGKMGQIEIDGFRWDTGPSVITMRHVFEDLFSGAGRRLDDYLTLLPVDPLTRYFFADGRVLDVVSDRRRLAEGLSATELADYERLLAYAAELHRITGPVFIYDQPPTWRSFLKIAPWDWLKVDAWRTMHAKIAATTQSAALRQLFGRFATYVGGSPYHAPATLNVIADVELNGGVWYPEGGIFAIARAYSRLADELGVIIQCGAPVAQIEIEAGRAVGVQLRNGRRLAAEAVVSNVDIATTYRHLLPDEAISARRRRAALDGDVSCSGFIMLLGIARQHPQLAHHNIWFSADYQAEFNAIFDRAEPAEEPTIYAAITSKTDGSHAPANCENWFILVNAPPLSANFDWETKAAAYGRQVLALLADRGVELRDAIRVQRLLTPLDLQRQSGAYRGALYGQSPNSIWSALRRPHNRSADVRNLYFSGGTTHPGGGVPMVTLSGKVAADLATADRHAGVDGKRFLRLN